MSNNKTFPDHSAFPEVQEVPQFSTHTYGLTKREYFAAMALQGLLAYPGDVDIAYAVKCADRLIEELNNEQQ